VKPANTPPHFETSSQLALSPTSLIACARRCAHGRHRAVFSQWAPPETVTTSRRSILCHENSHHKKGVAITTVPKRTAGQKRSKAKSRFEKIQHVVHLPLSIWAAAPRTTQNTWWLVAARLQRSCVAADPHHSENSGGCLPHDSKNTNQSRCPLRPCCNAKQNTLTC